VPDALGGTSGIVVDNISTQPQASSIYFAPLAMEAFSSPEIYNISSISYPGVFGLGSTGDTVTATTTVANGFTTGESVTIAGTGQSAMNGTFPIASVTNSTTFTYSITLNCLIYCGGASASTGTASGTSTTNAFAAVKLTQIGLD
jgi:hypothetical protein